MIVPRPGGQCEADVFSPLEGQSPTRLKLRRRGEVLDASGTKLAVSVVQPNLNPLSRKDLFHDEVRNSVAIHVCGGNRKSSFVRLEDQVVILPGSDVEPNLKPSPAVKFSGFEQDCSVGVPIIVEVSRCKPLCQAALLELRSSYVRQRSAQAVLRPQ